MGSIVDAGLTYFHQPRSSHTVGLGDFDGDGDLDAFVVNGAPTEPDMVWLNDGAGTFTDSGQRLGNWDGGGLEIGDVDADGDLDAYVTSGTHNTIWLNDGAAIFTDSGQSPGRAGGEEVALGDVDQDGDLDAFVVRNYPPNEVWLNDGAGTFVDSGQSLGSSASFAVKLGDVDGDGDLDAVVANNWGQPNKVWLNTSATALTVTIDIDPETLNLKIKGKWVTVYAELPEGYDVADINVGTVTLKGTIPAEAHPIEIGDYDNDGIPDLMVKFDRQALIEYLDGTTGEVTLTVSGELGDGTPFEGSDAITVINPGR
jgi:hypothetical protein